MRKVPGTNLPTKQQAERYLEEAESLNPGLWVQHSIQVADTAARIATSHPELDPHPAFVLGLLHDIGRRAGVHGMRHVIDGYHFMMEAGYPDAARICLTHSYPIQSVDSGSSPWDGTLVEKQIVADYLASIQYTSYDRLIQLCDAICLPEGPVLMEKRLLDVTLRYGPNQYTTRKWQAFFDIQSEFETTLGSSIYRLLPNVVQNTFGFIP
jgi:hypothetical protein